MKWKNCIDKQKKKRKMHLISNHKKHFGGSQKIKLLA